jgi:hypothetical protein
MGTCILTEGVGPAWDHGLAGGHEHEDSGVSHPVPNESWVASVVGCAPLGSVTERAWRIKGKELIVFQLYDSIYGLLVRGKSIQCNKVENCFDRGPGEEAVFIGFLLVLLPRVSYCRSMTFFVCRRFLRGMDGAFAK